MRTSRNLFGNSFERTSDTHPENTPPTSEREVNIPLVVPEGSTEVQYTFPLETKAVTQQMSAPDENNRPSANASFLIQVQRIDVGVAITSDIETSWKKWIGSVAELPDAYKQRNSSTHRLINQPNDKAVLVAPNPTDPNKDIWKLQCLRDADGSMTVESAGVPAALAGQQGWYGLTNFTANTVGYSNPGYAWSGPGDGPFNQQVLPADVIGISLGGDGVGNGMTSSTTNAVAVIDKSNSSMPASSNAYTVNWHKPDENWQKVTSTPGTATFISLGPSSNNGSPLSYEDANPITFAYHNSFFASGVASTDASALLAQPAPDATTKAGVMDFLNTSVGLSPLFNQALPAPQQVQVSCSFSDFKNAVLGDGDPNITDDTTGLTQGSLLLPSDFMSSLQNAQTSAQFPYWGTGNIYVSVSGYINNQIDAWSSDTYGHNGYQGTTPSSLVHEVKTTLIRHWSYGAPSTSNPPPTGGSNPLPPGGSST